MSIDALVFTREQPELGLGETDVENIEYVQIVAPRPVRDDDWRVARVSPDPSIGWVTEVNCANSAYAQLGAFSALLARRCGGGLFFCDLTGKTLAITAQTAPPRKSQELRRELKEVQLDADDGALPDAVEVAPAAAAPRELPHLQQWEIGAAARKGAETWVRPGLTTMFFALLEGDVARMRGLLDSTIEDVGLGPVIGLDRSAESAAEWVERTVSAGESMSCVKAASDGSLSVAHAGESRAYGVFARRAERLAGPAGRLLVGGHLVLCSAPVWRALGERAEAELVEVVEARRFSGAKAIAWTLLDRAPRGESAAVIVARHHAPARQR